MWRFLKLVARGFLRVLSFSTGSTSSRCKQGRTIPVIVSDRWRPLILHPLCISTHDTVRPVRDKCGTALIRIDTDPFIQEFSKHFKVVFLNVQSVRNKALDICD